MTYRQIENTPYIETSPGGDVWGVVSFSAKVTDEQRYQQSRLFKAAPDLLAACEAALDLLGNSRAEWPSNSVELACKAAIAKAKGGAT